MISVSGRKRDKIGWNWGRKELFQQADNRNGGKKDRNNKKVTKLSHLYTSMLSLNKWIRLWIFFLFFFISLGARCYCCCAAVVYIAFLFLPSFSCVAMFLSAFNSSSFFFFFFYPRTLFIMKILFFLHSHFVLFLNVYIKKIVSFLYVFISVVFCCLFDFIRISLALSSGSLYFSCVQIRWSRLNSLWTNTTKRKKNVPCTFCVLLIQAEPSTFKCSAMLLSTFL